MKTVQVKGLIRPTDKKETLATFTVDADDAILIQRGGRFVFEAGLRVAVLREVRRKMERP